MGDFAATLAVLANNQKDVEEIIAKFGGIGNIIRAAPNLIHIMQTASQHRDPVHEVEKIVHVLAYNDETKDKIEAFQKKHGLHVDGIVGNQTWGKVEELIK